MHDIGQVQFSTRKNIPLQKERRGFNGYCFGPHDPAVYKQTAVIQEGVDFLEVSAQACASTCSNIPTDAILSKWP